MILQQIQQIGKDPNWKVYGGVAVFLVGLAWGVMRWVARTIKADIDTGLKTGPRKSMAMLAQADLVPPALVKKALEKGLVTAAQIAKMNPTERQFLFSSLRVQLEASGDYRPTGMTPALGTEVVEPRASQLRSTTAMITPAPGTRPVTPPGGGRPTTPPGGVRPSRAMSGAMFGMQTMPSGEDLRVFCPSCGSPLKLPAFPPLVTHCDQCGNKTAVRQEEGGRLVLTVAPPNLPRKSQSLPEL